MLEINKIHCMDALEDLKQLPDKSIDLCLTDPPYGILNGLTQIGGGGGNQTYDPINWDNKPSQEVFNEIIRVSKNQIIFGGEHLSHLLPCSRGWYVWDKKRQHGVTFADGELIWTSFDKPLKFIRFMWDGFMKDPYCPVHEKIEHPTQKPVEIIRRLLKMHSNEGDLILDCFIGSGTTAVACKELKRNFLGFEINEEYCKIANKRLKQDNLLDYFQNGNNGKKEADGSELDRKQKI